MHGRCDGFDPHQVHSTTWAAGPTGRRRLRKPKIAVRFRGGPLTTRWAHRLTGRRQSGRLEIGVRFPVGPLDREEMEGRRIRLAAPLC